MPMTGLALPVIAGIVLLSGGAETSAIRSVSVSSGESRMIGSATAISVSRASARMSWRGAGPPSPP